MTSISVDLHKYGYTAKGAGVLVHRTKRLRRYQTFVTDNWLGGLYGSSGILGTKSGGSIAAAWAVLQYLGDDGYRRLAGVARRTCLRLAEAIAAVPRCACSPRRTPRWWRSPPPIRALDVVAVPGCASAAGWWISRDRRPSLHCMVNAVHETTIEAFIADLRECADRDGPERRPDRVRHRRLKSIGGGSRPEGTSHVPAVTGSRCTRAGDGTGHHRKRTERFRR